MALILAAVLLFACMDAIGKYLFQVRGYAVPLVQTARYTVNFFLVAALFLPGSGTSLLKTNRTALVWFRSLSLALGTFTASYAFKLMPVAETTAIIYLSTFGVLLLSGPLMKEKVRWYGWVATALAFSGLLLIVRPGAGLSPTGILWGLACAATTVVYHTLSRYLATTESTATLLFYTAFGGTIFFALQLPGNIGALPTGALDVSLFLLLGCLGMAGHFLFTAAYREAPLSLLTPVNYMHMAWAVLLGWLVFDHVPDFITLAGIGLIAVSGAGNALLNHRYNSIAAALEPEEV